MSHIVLTHHNHFFSGYFTACPENILRNLGMPFLDNKGHWPLFYVTYLRANLSFVGWEPNAMESVYAKTAWDVEDLTKAYCINIQEINVISVWESPSNINPLQLAVVLNLQRKMTGLTRSIEDPHLLLPHINISHILLTWTGTQSGGHLLNIYVASDVSSMVIPLLSEI